MSRTFFGTMPANLDPERVPDRRQKEKVSHQSADQGDPQARQGLLLRLPVFTVGVWFQQ